MTEPNKPKRSTYERALDMLEARSRAVAELRRLLIRKGEPEAEVDAAIERLRANGLLDDANFARQLTRSRA
jgi:regulatory protein